VDWHAEQDRVRREDVGAERLLLLLLVRDAAWTAAAAESVLPADFRDESYRELFQWMVQRADADSAAGGGGAVAAAPGSGSDATPPESSGVATPDTSDIAAAGAHVPELSRRAQARLDALRSDREEIADAAQTFRQTVADLVLPRLFLRLDDLEMRDGETTSYEEQADLMRERQRVSQDLRRLGIEADVPWKASKRYRAYPRTKRKSDGPPTTEA
jgi:hypothetical protein